MGASWGLLGASGCGGLVFSVRGPPLGPLLGPSWPPLGPVLGPSWAVLGPLGPSWGPLGGLLGCLGAVLGASWAVLERRKAKKATRPKSFKNQWKINDFGLLSLSWEASWMPHGASWRPLGPSRGHLRRLSGRLGVTFGVLDRLEGLLGPSWTDLEPSWAPKKSSGISDPALPGLTGSTFRPGTPRGRPARAN